jgi:hypothetical protein
MPASTSGRSFFLAGRPSQSAAVWMCRRRLRRSRGLAKDPILAEQSVPAVHRDLAVDFAKTSGPPRDSGPFAPAVTAATWGSGEGACMPGPRRARACGPGQQPSGERRTTM